MAAESPLFSGVSSAETVDSESHGLTKPNGQQTIPPTETLGSSRELHLQLPRESFGPDTRTCCDSNVSGVAVSLVILANTTVIGYECQDIGNPETKDLFWTLELGFCFIYCVELIVRCVQGSLRKFFCATDLTERSWNMFDFTTTIIGLVGVFAEEVTHVHLNASVLRLFRVLRILRVFRILKFVKDIEYTLVSTLFAMFRVMALVLMIDFIGAVVITHLLKNAQDEVVLEMFGTLTSSMYHLFIVMVDGMGSLHVVSPDDIIIITEKVTDIYPQMWIFWTAFVFVGSISLMALVPAIFVELNLRDADCSRQISQKIEWENRVEAQRAALQVVFHAADKDRSNAISRREMDLFLQQEDVMKQIGLDQETDDAVENEDRVNIRQLRMEFSMVYDEIEAHGRYELSWNEFIDAFRQMRSKPMDQVVLTLQQEIFKLRTLMTKQNNRIKSEIKALVIPRQCNESA